MKNPFINFNRTKALSYGLFFLSGIILLVSLVLTMNVEVLRNWKIVVPDKPIHLGDTVVIASEYEKLKDVTGKASRYIECQNTSRVYIRYPLNEAVANRGSGKGGTGIEVKVPETIPNVPTTCKFTIAIVYDVYPWRKVNHATSSNTFTLLPKEVSEVQVQNQQTIQTNQVVVQSPKVSSPQSSSSNTSNNTNTVPRESSQPQPVPEEQPSLLERVISPVTNLVDRIL